MSPWSDKEVIPGLRKKIFTRQTAMLLLIFTALLHPISNCPKIENILEWQKLWKHKDISVIQIVCSFFVILALAS